MEKRLLVAYALIFVFLSLKSKLCNLSMDGMLFKGHASEKLYNAAKNNNAKTVTKILSSNQAMIDTRGSSSDNTPLMEAARSGNLTIVESLIAYGADTRLRNKSGQTALDLARQSSTTSENKNQILKTLKLYGATEGK
jgi:ankyrin repeat protein